MCRQMFAVVVSAWWNFGEILILVFFKLNIFVFNDGKIYVIENLSFSAFLSVEFKGCAVSCQRMPQTE